MIAKKTARSFVFLAVAVLLGCNSSGTRIEKQATVPVTGIVKYKGSPVANASVIFQALDGKVSSHGTTDAAGTFTLSTYGNQDGAPVGRYKVTVAANTAKESEPGVLADEPPGGFKSPVPMKYSNPTTTDIVVEVKAEGKNDFTIELK